MTAVPTIKGKVTPIFPSKVIANSPILLDTTGGVYDFSLDMDAIAESIVIPTNGPSAKVGLTPVLGVSTAAMRSDGAPPIDQAIAPTWTGTHTWTTGGQLLGTTGLSPPISFVDPFFTFLGTQHTYDLVRTLGSSNTEPEIGRYTYIRSASGAANPYAAPKIGQSVVAVADSGAGTFYSGNFVAQSTTNFNGLLTGVEIDLNQGSGLTQGTFGSLNSSYNLVLSGNPRLAAGQEAVAASWVTGTNVWRYGYAVTGGCVQADIYSSGTPNVGLQMAGAYGLFAVDLSTSTSGLAPLRYANNVGPAWVNAAGTGNVFPLKVGTDNQLKLFGPDIGAATGTSLNGVAINSTTTGSGIIVVGGKTLNVQNSLAIAGADGGLWTLPGNGGQVASLPQMGTLEFTLSAANFNSTADQPITITLPTGRTRYQLLAVIVSNPSISLTTAVGGIYTAAAKGGVAVVGAGTVYSTLTTNTAGTSGSLFSPGITNSTTAFYNSATLYFALTTAQGAAATADITIQIRPLP
jgi:hypothetical protein